MSDLYLIDSSTVITLQNTYYAKNRVREFWEWLLHHASAGRCNIVEIIFDEITPHDGDFKKWLTTNKRSLILESEPPRSLVERVVQFYAPDLTEDELEMISNDPFLIACALQRKLSRCVVTTEVPKPSKKRANRRIPDVCNDLGVKCIDPVRFIRDLDL